MISKFFSFILGIFLGFFSPIIKHVKVLYGQFDPILDGPTSIKSRRQLNQLADYRKERVEADRVKHDFFFNIWGLFVFNILDNIYVLWMDDFDYYNRRMSELLYHKMYPERFWPQSDLIMFSIVLYSLVVYYNLWRGDWLDDRYNMYFIGLGTDKVKLIVNNRGMILLDCHFYAYDLISLLSVWDKKNAKNIYAFREANRRARKICMACSYFFFQPYFQYHLWSKWERSLRHAFMSGYLSILLCYTVFGKCKLNDLT